MSDVAIVAMTDVALMAAAAHEVEDIVTHGAPPPRDAQARRLSRAPARGSDALILFAVWWRMCLARAAVQVAFEHANGPFGNVTAFQTERQ